MLIEYCVFSFPGFSSVVVCVHNGMSNTSTAAELAEFREKHNILRKTQYLMNTLCRNDIYDQKISNHYSDFNRIMYIHRFYF